MVVCKCAGPVGGEYKCETEMKNGTIVGFKFLGVSHNAEAPNSTETNLLTFKHDGTFDNGKGDGDRGLSDAIYQNDKEAYNNALEGYENALKEAKGSLEKSVSGREDNDAVKTAVGSFLDAEKGGTLEEVSIAAGAADQTASDNWRTENTVKSKVSNAYVSIGNAIKTLLRVTAKTADTVDYSNMTDAVGKHKEASERLNSDSRLAATVERYAEKLWPDVMLEEAIRTLSAAKAPKKDGKGSPYAEKIRCHMPLRDAAQIASRKTFLEVFA